MKDFVLRNVSLFGEEVVDAAVCGGQWSAIGKDLGCGYGQEIDAEGKILLPGVIDAHVHFNEPGRTDWEGIETGSRALSAGGGTAFFDMPLNSSPPVFDGAGMRLKRTLCAEKSRVDFGIWGGLTPDSLGGLEEMADEGVIGYKAFMCGSGLEEFGKAGRKVLAHGMKVAARRGLVVGVHAEDESLIGKSGFEDVMGSSLEGMRMWFASRPVEAELAAIRIAMELAGESGVKLHVVHVTHPDGLNLIEEGRRNGVDVSAETCPHYLLLNTGMGARIGAFAKCAPPLRDGISVEGMWGLLKLVETIGSDHSPSPPEMKAGENVFAIWGGIAGCQHGIELVCNEAMRRGIPLKTMAEKWRGGVLRRFGLGGGSLEAGQDADFFLLEKQPGIIKEEDLLYRHRISAYVGWERDWRVLGTWLRGRRVGDETRGRFLRPSG
ncbi:MAG: allantoinase AllB [Armatimonadetes bacterium]|nr:allantoinase AllB [Akkermansiaceae bacterium]